MSGPSFDLADLYGAAPQAPGALDLSSILGPSTAQQTLAQYRSGELAQRMAAANQRDQANLADAQASTPGYLTQLLQRGAANLLNTAQTIPGVETFEAGAGALGSHIPGLTPVGGPLSYQQSLDALRGATSDIPGVARVGEQLAGGLLAPALLPEGRILQAATKLAARPALAGAAYGAATGALSATPNSPWGRIGETALGAGGGAIAGKAAGAIGGLAQRTGLTDFISRHLQQRGGSAADLGAAIGTEGAANRLLAARQGLEQQVAGSENTAAQTVLDHVNKYRANAGELYRKASADGQVVNDAGVHSLLNDPVMSKFYGIAKALYKAKGGEIPMGVTGRIEVPSQILDEFSRPFTTTQAITSELPNPEVLALTKRLADQAARGYGSGNTLTQENAIAVLPKVNELRNRLHAISPAWAEADQYTSMAKGFQDAYTRAYGAQQRVTAAGLNPDKVKSPEAVNAWVQSAQGRPTYAARVAGQRAGAAGRITEQLRNTPLGMTAGEGLAGVLDPFSPAAAAVRAPAFETPSDAQDFAKTLGALSAQSQRQASTIHGYGVASIPGIPFHVMGRPNLGAKNPLATDAGAALRARLSTMLSSQAGRQEIAQRLAAASRGQALLGPIEQELAGGVGGLLGSFGGRPTTSTYP